jgi:hypothetical protein
LLDAGVIKGLLHLGFNLGHHPLQARIASEANNVLHLFVITPVQNLLPTEA